jgi:hypothetical protein
MQAFQGYKSVSDSVTDNSLAFPPFSFLMLNLSLLNFCTAHLVAASLSLTQKPQGSN